MDLMMTETRNSIIDNLKFFLIVLVIFGHVSNYVVFDRNLPTVRIEGYLKHIIYAFHMPLFIFISGKYIFELFVTTPPFKTSHTA